MRPDRAYFGQKDAQQAAVVERLVTDLNLELEIRVVPTVREEDGLAVSSRNAYLSADEREAAAALPKALRAGEEAQSRGADPLEAARAVLAAETGLEPEYVELATARRPGLPARSRPGGTHPPHRQRRSGRRPAVTSRPRTDGKLPLTELADMKSRGEPIVMVTAYDYPSGRIADAAGIDVVLVGDSAAMTVLGNDSTVPATMDEMLMLTRAAARGAERPLVVADMPFGSFQVSDEDAVRNGIRFVKEAGRTPSSSKAQARRSRASSPSWAPGIPVMGHVGLTPQSATMLGGFRAQGRTAEKARALLQDARALEAAGCFAIVLEAVPAQVAARITESLTVPTIGIGSGRGCDGQVLVFHDLLGLYDGKAPRFVKRYADLAAETRSALERYAADVRSGAFPGDEHTYSIPEDELAAFEAAVSGSRAESGTET